MLSGAQKEVDVANQPIITPCNAWKNKEFYLKNLLQDPWYAFTSKLLSAIYVATHDFFEKKSIKPFVFPITTGSVSSPMGMGSDSLPVQISLRGNDVFLADSMQFSLEVGTRLNRDGAYYVMPTFRGESVDSRHLNEFVHAEVEIPGVLNDVQDLAEGYIRHLVAYLLENCEKEVAEIAGDIDHLLLLSARRDPFTKISYSDAIQEILSVDGALEDIGTGFSNITALGEKALMRKHGDFIWLTHMPWRNVPFYQAQLQGTAYSMTGDLLAGIGEILGCGQRVGSLADLEESLRVHNVSAAGYEWYAEMRDLCPMQTSGFGLGIERFLLWATQTNDIRNCSLLYRDHNQIFYP
ncbi:MAG: asparaginase [Alphaproteobacteria bacterium]|nr:asparaginase [Alphaproteobacteria bacterium]